MISQMEALRQADKFLVIAHGTPEQVTNAHHVLAGPCEAAIHHPESASVGSH